VIHAVGYRSNALLIVAIVSVLLLSILMQTIIARWHGLPGEVIPFGRAADLADAGRRTLAF